MPELAEVAFACTQWKPGLNRPIQSVITHPKSRVYRDENRAHYRELLTGRILRSFETHGKQMLFSFSGNCWLGLHLGMTGWLHYEPKGYQPTKHDALVLVQAKQSLVFRDPRQFGRLRLHIGKEAPDWWNDRPVSMVSREFNYETLSNALNRHKKRPLKALLLDQRYFPGMGNWMADEVLWRSGIHPDYRPSNLEENQKKTLFQQILFVVRGAMKSVGTHGGDPPANWLFHQRWRDGGTCPKSGTPLMRAEIGGRTSCWSPVLQSLGK
jgi:formamidopyrimidine-DNA glycosylase